MWVASPGHRPDSLVRGVFAFRTVPSVKGIEASAPLPAGVETYALTADGTALLTSRTGRGDLLDPGALLPFIDYPALAKALRAVGSAPSPGVMSWRERVAQAARRLAVRLEGSA